MIKLGIIMDPISSINIKKDSSLAMLIEAQRRNYKIYYMEMNFLYLYGRDARATTYLLSLKQNNDMWYNLSDKQDISLKELDVILMRKNPPFNTEFIYATYILERAENKGVLVINKPQSLRDYNEKIFITWFPQYMPSTLISCQDDHIRAFLQQNNDIIIKPLDRMGGASIFRVKKDDPNVTVIIENLTDYGKCFCMAQRYLPTIVNGDKRVLIVNGTPLPYCLARIPKTGETRANLAAGSYGEVRSLSKNDWKIANDVSLVMKEKGLIFVGLDIIGDYLTEINITSPTCIQEIESARPISITGIIMDAIEKILGN